ncbi:MAG: AAA family ATPase [Hylemonella sp.]|jgi:exodeoxyribonuclease V alpha subunit|nr:AAA family ATPase [Hylemonella sp.]
MTDVSVQLKVTSILNRGRFGGVLFAGRTEENQYFVADCSYKLISDPGLVDKGQQWVVVGPATQRQRIVNGYAQDFIQIDAQSAEMVRPTGRNIISWIANCEDCPGVGVTKATKLWNHFGASLVTLIEDSDVTALSEFIKLEHAELLCHAFKKHGVAGTLLWLDQVGIQRRIGAKVVDFYKHEAQVKIESNPYLLLSFEASWKAVDALAYKRFGMLPDDPRRLEAAIEEALYRGFDKGHTCLPLEEVQSWARLLLDSTALAKQALVIDAGSTQFRRIDGVYQTTGMHIIEQYVCDRIKQMVAGENERGQVGLFDRPTGNLQCVPDVLHAFEQANGISLSQEQHDAVVTSISAHLSLILGGAGTGKTTVLKALYEVLEELHAGVTIYQIALAGMAAQRMQDATGRDSMTIAGFLTKIDSSQIPLGCVVVVDEASMVDVILMHRLLRHLPSGVRLILVGDPSQLPPIGPGLVLHALVGLPSIPQTALKVVKRQSSASGIPQVAAVIRSHQKPTWAPYLEKPDVGVSFVPCSLLELDKSVERVYEQIGGNGEDFSVGILCTTKANQGGVAHLNTSLHDLYRQNAEPVSCFSPEFGVVGATTLARLSIRVGDLVMFTKNDYELGLRNGSLGKITHALAVISSDDPCCVAEFDGVAFELNTTHIQALTHAYAITVHKSQGSQFKRVVVPIRDSRMLDQALIYTAVTRGVEQVVLVGDEKAALRAIQAPALASRRYTTLPARLLEIQP